MVGFGIFVVSNLVWVFLDVFIQMHLFPEFVKSRKYRQFLNHVTLCRLEGEILLYESLHTNLFSVEPLVPHSYKKKTKLEASDLTSSFFFVLYIQLKKGDICMGDVKREYRCL